MADGFSNLGPTPAAVPLVAALAAALVVLALVVATLRWGFLRLLAPKAPPIEGKEGQEEDLLQVVVEEEEAADALGMPLEVSTLVAERPIGSGGQGGVWLAYDPTSGKKCALKQLRKGRLAALKRASNVKPAQCQWLIEREALLKCGGHPFITTCYAAFQDDQSLYFALELASGGDLFSLLHTSEAGQLPEVQARFYTACVGLALKHIHAMGFLYCDIKLENVLVTADGYVKLCDFGLAKKLTRARKRCSLFGARDTHARSYSKCGTDQYAPPEVVHGTGRSKAADWWALGVLLHEMLTGHSPFEGKGMAEIFSRVEEYAAGGAEAAEQLMLEVKEDAADLSDEGTDFLLGLLTPSEAGRIGCGRGGFAASVQAHPWFGALDWVKLLRQQLPAPYVPAHAVATDRKGTHEPTGDEIRDEVAALFNAKTGVLRERPFNPATWQHLFDPFGATVARVIQAPEAAAATPSASSCGAPASTTATAATAAKAHGSATSAASSTRAVHPTSYPASDASDGGRPDRAAADGGRSRAMAPASADPYAARRAADNNV